MPERSPATARTGASAHTAVAARTADTLMAGIGQAAPRSEEPADTTLAEAADSVEPAGMMTAVAEGQKCRRPAAAERPASEKPACR